MSTAVKDTSPPLLKFIKPALMILFSAVCAMFFGFCPDENNVITIFLQQFSKTQSGHDYS
jgi:hypothetical protein